MRGSLAAELTLFCVICAPADSRVPVRLLLIGTDGLDWKVALPLVKDGRIPELAEPKREGRFGRLATALRTVSRALGTSIATGKTADRHGIVGFGRGRPVEVDEHERTKPLRELGYVE
jgi:predicted AlkP superfamily phosphohydrolase/phosphomutase